MEASRCRGTRLPNHPGWGRGFQTARGVSTQSPHWRLIAILLFLAVAASTQRLTA